jgi:group I intron endonuclease
MKAPVIYKITNVVNGKFYVGSTMDTRERFRTHRNKLRGNRHHCAHLQAAWNKYGEVCFHFAVVEEVASMEALQAAEDVWLAHWVGKEECYNVGMRSGAPMRGRFGERHPSFGTTVSEEQKTNISKKLKAFYAEDPANHPRLGKKHTPEALAKIAANRTAPVGEAHYRYGKTVSIEVREKIGAAQRGKQKAPGRVISEEGMAKIRAAAAAGHYASFKGKRHTEEAKAKIRKPILVTDGKGTQKEFSSITALRAETGLLAPTVNRALKSGLPIAKGDFRGWVFKYLAPPEIK